MATMTYSITHLNTETRYINRTSRRRGPSSSPTAARFFDAYEY
ncbi:hypothetical protein ACFL4G_04465 [Thermodesulfobacteriota bacterium]